MDLNLEDLGLLPDELLIDQLLKRFDAAVFFAVRVEHELTVIRQRWKGAEIRALGLAARLQHDINLAIDDQRRELGPSDEER